MKIAIIPFVAVLLFVLTSCGSVTDPVYDSAFYEQSSWQNDKLESGSGTAFYYFYKSADDPSNTDDEVEETLKFVIDSGLTEFNVKDTALIPLQIIWDRSCFCGPCHDSLPIHRGSITGKKLNSNTWSVSVHIFQSDTSTLKICRTLDFDRNFELRSR
jgi:hypothetical protein